MTLSELKTYFETYATANKQLMHIPGDRTNSAFFCVQTDQNINDFVRSCKMDLFIVLMPYDKKLNKADAQNYTWNKHVAFLVLKRVSGKDQVDIINAQSSCEQISDDFCTRLINDRHTKIDSIEDGSINSLPVGPFGDNVYGFMTMFTLLDYFDQQVNLNNWNG